MGENHAAVITHDKQVFAWGANCKGQLGLDDIEDRLEPSLLSFDESEDGNRAVLISCGASFTFLVTELNEIKIAGQIPFKIVTNEGGE